MFSDFTERYRNHFSKEKNIFVELLEKDNFKNLAIRLLENYDEIENKVNVVNKHKCVYRKLFKQYKKKLKIHKNTKMLQCDKAKINDKTPMGKVMLMTKIDELKTKFKDTPLEDKIELLAKYKNNFYEFEKEYNKLLPYDCELLLDNIKHNISPYYIDFYTSFIPIIIQKELENKKQKMVCYWKDYNNGYYSINSKIPIKRNVSINKHKHVKLYEINEPIRPGTGKTPVSKINIQNIELDKYRRIIARMELILDQSFDINLKPFNIQIFESTHNKTINWYDRIIVNKNKDYSNELMYKYVGPLEVNTGYTIVGFGSRENKITIYRSEELDKVLIHEFMHLMYIDAGLVNDPKLIKIFKRHLKYDKFCSEYSKYNYCDADICVDTCTYSDKYNDGSILRLNEAYADFCADLINSFLYAVELKDNFDDAMNLYCKFLVKEINFALFQAAKILMYFDFDSYHDIFKNSYNSNKTEILLTDTLGVNTRFYERKNNKLIKQSTCLFSYFILKVVLLLNIDKIYDGLEKNNNLFRFLSTENNNNAKIVKNIIKEHLLDINNFVDVYMEIITFFKIKFVNEISTVEEANEYKNTIDDTLMETMRRSLIELK